MNFNKKIAVEFGVEEAIIIQNIKFWIEKNKANGVHLHKGSDDIERTWTYNSIPAFEKLFPFWTYKQIRRILKSLIDNEIIVVGKFNKNNSDRTNWYAFKDEESFFEVEKSEPKRADEASAQTGSSISPKGQFHKPKRADVPSAQTGSSISPNGQMFKGTDVNTDINTVVVADSEELQQQLFNPDFIDEKEVNKAIEMLYKNYCGYNPHPSEVSKINETLVDINYSRLEMWKIIKKVFFDFNSFPKDRQNTGYILGAIKGRRNDLKKSEAQLRKDNDLRVAADIRSKILLELKTLLDTERENFSDSEYLYIIEVINRRNHVVAKELIEKKIGVME